MATPLKVELRNKEVKEMSAFEKFLIEKYVETKMKIEEFMKNEKGEANLIAVILILAIVVVLVIVFKDQITDMVNRIFDKANADVDTVLS